jgi:hypothetical protein
MNVLPEVEDMILRFFRTLPIEDLRELYTPSHVENRIDEETRAELENFIVTQIWNRIHWRSLLDRIQEELEEENVEEEDNASECSEDSGSGGEE